MTRSDQHVVVVGGGPAGLAAAVAAHAAGLRTTIVEERRLLGGNFHLGRPAEPAREGSPAWFERRAGGASVVLNSAVVDAPSCGTLTISGPDGSRQITYSALVIATGAHDRGVPIPGWTLPGVLTAGGALAMAKAHHVAPGMHVLVAGSGPFLLPVAAVIGELGARVTILEATPSRLALRAATIMCRDPHLVGESIGYLVRTARRRIRYRHGRAVVRIEGDDRVREVVHARVDANWRPIAGTEQREAVDAVALGYGFVPSTELPQLMGCALRYDGVQRGYGVVVDRAQQTSIANVFAAGELTGVAGERVAALEGRLAGLSAAATLGAFSAEEYAQRSCEVIRALKRLNRTARWLASAFRPRDGLWSALANTDIICRCEDIQLGSLMTALEGNAIEPRAAKSAARAGMGLCQGRVCSGAITEILRMTRSYRIPADSRPWSVQPPLRPTLIAEWADLAEDVGQSAAAPT